MLLEDFLDSLQGFELDGLGVLLQLIWFLGIEDNLSLMDRLLWVLIPRDDLECVVWPFLREEAETESLSRSSFVAQ